MPELPDFPGKDLIEGTSKRARAIAVGAGAGALALGGFVARRVLGGRGDEEREGGAESDSPPMSGTQNGEVETAIADPGIAMEPSPPKPKPAKPKAAEKPPKAKREPGDQRGGKDPHHALNNPVVDPDPTEYPDPFDKREDPRDPVDPDGMPFGEEPHPPTGAESTSEPPPALDPEVGDRAKPPARDKLDD
jgi:hypothetical protein